MPGRRSYVLASSSSAQVAAEMEDKRSSRRRFSDLLNDDEDYGKMKMWFLLTDLLVFTFALVVVGVSSYALSDESNLRVLLGVAGGGIDDGEGAAVVLVVAGIAAAAVAAEGAVAVLKDSPRLLLLHLVLLASAFVLLCVGVGLVASASVAAGGQGPPQVALEQSLLASMAAYEEESTGGDSADVVAAWDDIQEEFKCCGVLSYEDWPDYCPSLRSPEPYRVPEVCCANMAAGTPGGESLSVESCRRNPHQYLAVGADGAAFGTGCAAPVEAGLAGHADRMLWTAVTEMALVLFNFVVTGVLRYRE